MELEKVVVRGNFRLRDLGLGTMDYGDGDIAPLPGPGQIGEAPAWTLPDTGSAISPMATRCQWCPQAAALREGAQEIETIA